MAKNLESKDLSTGEWLKNSMVYHPMEFYETDFCVIVRVIIKSYENQQTNQLSSWNQVCFISNSQWTKHNFSQELRTMGR